MARQDYQGAPISGVTGNVAGSTTSDSGSDFISGGDSDRNYTAAIRDSKGNITNPYPDGFFSRIFGAENVSYAGLLDQNQMAGIESMRYNRYNNPQAAVSKGFGSLFGGAEGEMTVAGPRVAQIQPATTGQNLAGLGFSLAIPGVGALSRAARTTYVPEGYLNKDFDSPSALSATSEIATGISPEAVGSMYDRAAGYVDQAKEGIRSFFTDNDVDGVIDNLERPMDKYAGQGGRDLLAAQITPAAPTADYDTIAAGGRDDVRMKAAPFSLPISSSEPYEIQSSPMLDQTTPSPDIRFPDDPSRQTVYEAMLNPDYQSGRHSIALPNGAVAELINGRFTGARRGLTP